MLGRGPWHTPSGAGARDRWPAPPRRDGSVTSGRSGRPAAGGEAGAGVARATAHRKPRSSRATVTTALWNGGPHRRLLLAQGRTHPRRVPVVPRGLPQNVAQGAVTGRGDPPATPAPTAVPVVTSPPAPRPTAAPIVTTPVPTTASPAGGNALDLYDDNGNGRITCAEARAHGIAPVERGHPAYEYMRDGDGVVCE